MSNSPPEEVAKPRLAAAAILVREPTGGESLELLLTQRNHGAKFMGGFWVFPGGSVDAADGTGDDGLLAAARRELREEAGIELSADTELLKYAHWITPEALPRRFDTHFFIAEVPSDTVAVADGEECVDCCWITAKAALTAVEKNKMSVAFPTLKQLHHLAQFDRAGDLFVDVLATEIVPIQPRIVGLPDSPQVLMPGEETESSF